MVIQQLSLPQEAIHYALISIKYTLSVYRLSPRKIFSTLSLQHLRELATCDQLYYLGRLNAIRNLLTNLCSFLGGACETL